MKNEGKKIQSENIKELKKINDNLRSLHQTSKELQDNVERSGKLLQTDLFYKIKCGLEQF